MKTVSNTSHKLLQLAGRLTEALRDPVAERLEVERNRDGRMFRRHGAHLPWAS
jgi:hypothetical protein